MTTDPEHRLEKIAELLEGHLTVLYGWQRDDVTVIGSATYAALQIAQGRIDPDSVKPRPEA